MMMMMTDDTVDILEKICQTNTTKITKVKT